MGLGAALGVLLLGAASALPAAPRTLTREVHGALDAANVAQPVTAVLLVFRGYDTLLEVGVLLLAWVAALSVVGLPSLRSVPGVPGVAGVPARHPLLRAATGHLVPVMVLVAGHLVMLGTRGPGGAFQAGAVLAATFVLLWIAGHRTLFGRPALLQRLVAAGGFVFFFVAALAPALRRGGSPFAWSASATPAVVLAVELLLMLGIGATLAALFVTPQAEERER